MTQKMLRMFLLALLAFAGTMDGWAQTGQVSGQVVFDGTSDGVEGAEILLMGNGATYYTTTDSDGAYAITVSEGTYVVGVRLIYQELRQILAYTEYYNNATTLNEATFINASANQPATVDFSVPDIPGLVAAGSTFQVTGTVTDADTGQPIAGATVMISDFDGNVIQPDSSFTNGQGQYSATIPAYVQQLKAWVFADGYARQFYNNAPSLQTASEILVDPQNPDITGLDFALTPASSSGGARMQGRVTNEPGNSLYEALVVAIHAETNAVRYALTDFSGAYDLTGLESGQYYVLFLAEGYVPEYFGDVQAWTQAELVEVISITQGIDARLGGLNRPPIGSGTRLFDTEDIILTGNATLQASGLPSPNTLITIRDDENKIIGFDLTDQQGMYKINNLVPGNFTAQADRVGFNQEMLEVSLEDTGTFAQTLARFSLMSQTPTDIETGQETPERFFLKQNYPNPFNPTTTIQYSLPQATHVRLVVYDMLGRTVATLVDKQQAAGTQAVRFQPPANLASGPYYYRLTAEGIDETRQMILLK